MPSAVDPEEAIEDLRQFQIGPRTSRYEIKRASPSLMMSSLLTSPATPSIPKATQSSPVPIPRARSQKWRSTSWFAATEHGGSPQARTLHSDQAAPSNPMVTPGGSTSGAR